MTVRMRYAPSPTGDPHVGNVRQALWSWLHTRRHGGSFIVRLEDTDQSRAVPGSLERILASLRWLGIDWDEGPDIGGPFAPYVQSERLDLYQAAIGRLLDGGHAYRCFCSSEELAALRKRQQTERRPTGYEGQCRALAPTDSARRAAGGEPCTVRFRMPDQGATTWNDALRGDITVENALLDDFIILKSDGFPTYHLAHVVDDHAMEITHVTRGDEWIPSAPRHIRLFEALGYEPPVFVHMPVILGPDGGKLSKRHGAKFVLDYAAEGYLPDALFNFLAILGWSLDGHTEIMSRERLIESFDVMDLSVNSALFDTQKLEWMNGVYLRDTAEDRLAELFVERLESDLPPAVPRPLDGTLVRAFTPLVRERVKLLSDLAPLVDFFFIFEPPASSDLLGKRYRDAPEAAGGLLAAAAAAIEGIDEWDHGPLEEALRALAEERETKAGDLFMLCRAAITGKSVTPPLFETMTIVGREACLDRLLAAAEMLRGEPGQA